MVRLKLFGAPSVERSGTPLVGRVVQRHRIALLALLALAPSRRMSRDKLIATLWPESSAEQGRNLLKVSSYVIRGELGTDALQSVGDDLQLAPGAVEVDVLEFDAAVTAGDCVRAVELQRAPFLDGFFLSDAPEFEEWAERERTRLSGALRRAVETLAESAEAAGDMTAAIEWWRTRAVQEPHDSRVALRLMRALEASGNRAGALKHASIHQRILKEEYGVESSTVAQEAERLRLAQTAERPVSYELAAPDKREIASAPENVILTERPTEAAVTHTDGSSSSMALGVFRWFDRRRAAAIAVALLGLILLLTWELRGSGEKEERSIVVLPFVNLSADPEFEYFSDGVTEEIITRLSTIPGLKVISRTSAMRYKSGTTPLPQIARELGVVHVLEGSVRRSDGRVRITAQLIDARGDAHVWAENYDQALDDVVRVQDEIAREVARALELRLGDRTQQLLARRGTRDAEAHRLYQRARFLWNQRTREGHERAIEYFQLAIARDSSYADPYAGLADVYLTAFQLRLSDADEEESYSRVKWAAERALALDSASADAHTSFAVALWWQRNWPGAAREFRLAIELNPGHATARSWYSLLLRGMARPKEALAQARHAAELDPYSVVVSSNYGWQCYLSRDYDCAEEQWRRVLEISPFPAAYRGLAFVHTQRGRHADALRLMQQAIDAAPPRSDFVADRAYVLARGGRTPEARNVLATAKREPDEGFSVARAHVALGEADSAFAWIRRSNLKWPHRASLADPALDPIRRDPRFSQLETWLEREMGMR